MECTVCHKKKQLPIKRCKHFELGGDKKRKVNNYRLLLSLLLIYKCDWTPNKKLLISYICRLVFGGQMFDDVVSLHSCGTRKVLVLVMRWYIIAILGMTQALSDNYFYCCCKVQCYNLYVLFKGTLCKPCGLCYCYSHTIRWFDISRL